MTKIKIIVEKHPDGYVAYPLGLKGVVGGEGDSYEAALADVQSAIRFHIESFGKEVFEEEESPVLEAFVAETRRGGLMPRLVAEQSGREVAGGNREGMGIEDRVRRTGESPVLVRLGCG
jgi:predicted RNase H-like HicB family nuclease